MVAVAEAGTHAIIDAEISPYNVSENKAAGVVLDRLEPGQLCLADRGFYSYRAWTRAARTGADLCFRVQGNLNLPVIEELGDGSFLSHIYDSQTDRTRQHPTRVRVIEYSLDDGVADHHETYRLITTITNSDSVSAAQLAAAYTERWEIETAFDELKTHQRGPRRVLRTAKPDLVEQEIWGHLCCHYAIRSLMYDATVPAGRDPDRASFVTALRITRRSIAQEGAFSPEATGIGDSLWAHTIRELRRRQLPHRQLRSNPRAVKRKYVRWHVKRAKHYLWPQPQRHGLDAVIVCN